VIHVWVFRIVTRGIIQRTRVLKSVIVHKAVPEPVHVYATKSHVGVLV